MLIDTARIDRLRVNFVAHFQTDNNAIQAANEIYDLIDSYPKAMTSQIRHWFNEQQKHRSTAPLAMMDQWKNIDEFTKYIQELEDYVRQYQQNESHPLKFKVVSLQCIAVRQSCSSSYIYCFFSCSDDDRTDR
jgi:hypothetical protein